MTWKPGGEGAIPQLSDFGELSRICPSFPRALFDILSSISGGISASDISSVASSVMDSITVAGTIVSYCDVSAKKSRFRVILSR